MTTATSWLICGSQYLVLETVSYTHLDDASPISTVCTHNVHSQQADYQQRPPQAIKMDPKYVEQKKDEIAKEVGTAWICADSVSC